MKIIKMTDKEYPEKLRKILQENHMENIYNESNNKQEIEEEYIQIYTLLLDKPQDIQYLSINSGLNISQIYQKLSMMELKGYIKRLPGNQYIKL